LRKGAIRHFAFRFHNLCDDIRRGQDAGGDSA
jgi:hypothetical protein